MSGQLDEISRAIGGIENYVHENRHASANLSMKFDALAHDIAKRVEALETRLGMRITSLEELQQQRAGAWQMFDWIIKSPLVGWLIALGAGVYLLVKGGKP